MKTMNGQDVCILFCLDNEAFYLIHRQDIMREVPSHSIKFHLGIIYRYKNNLAHKKGKR